MNSAARIRTSQQAAMAASASPRPPRPGDPQERAEVADQQAEDEADGEPHDNMSDILA